MSLRLLLDPTPDASGGGPLVQTATPTPTPSPTPAPAPAATDSQSNLIMTLSQRLSDAERRNAEHEAAERQRQAEAARIEQDKLVAQGDATAAKTALERSRADHERELAVERGKLAEVERRSRTASRDQQLATALAAHPLADDETATQLMALLAGQLEAHPEGESYTVRTKDFVSVKDFVARELAKPAMAKFLRPSTQGGTDNRGTNRSTQQTPDEDRVTSGLRQGAAKVIGAIGLSAVTQRTA